MIITDNNVWYASVVAVTMKTNVFWDKTPYCLSTDKNMEEVRSSETFVCT